MSDEQVTALLEQAGRDHADRVREAVDWVALRDRTLAACAGTATGLATVTLLTRLCPACERRCHVWCYARVLAAGHGSPCRCRCWAGGRLVGWAAADMAAGYPDTYATHLATLAAFAAATVDLDLRTTHPREDEQ